jgi:hypothetical protein
MGSFPDFLSWFRVSNHRVLPCSLIFHIRSLVGLGWGETIRRSWWFGALEKVMIEKGSTLIKPNYFKKQSSSSSFLLT